MMPLEQFLAKIRQNEPVGFQETMAVIAENYEYQPVEFSNGLGEDQVINAPGANEGSCKIFAFAQLNGLDEQQTLGLFGDYYRVDVMQNPNGTDHKNIRNFIKYGWKGVNYKGEPLVYSHLDRMSSLPELTELK